MINYSKFTLDNGLRVLVHEDKSTPMVAVNVVYDVGSRDEDPGRTGFAHLFEHLMFGGSVNIPDFDKPIQFAGGENNAFTNSDMTCFYDVLPAQNIETAFWLESDRMMQLDFSQKALELQQKVVVEEFKETCLNRPFGDMWHHIAEMAYQDHPYKWPTIGKIPKHIEEARLEDVKDFFYRFYRPNNAILVVAGKVTKNEVKRLSEKWFGEIPRGEVPVRNLPEEKKQIVNHNKEISAKVPVPAFYLGFHMSERGSRDYYAGDLLSDILSNGSSSRFYRRLLKEKELFSTIDAYVSGTIDPGMFIVEGKPMPGVSIEEGKATVWNELREIMTDGVGEAELQKIKNKMESSLVYSEVNILNKAINLAYFELMGDASLINRESEIYQSITTEDIRRVANEIFRDGNCNELTYYPN